MATSSTYKSYARGQRLMLTEGSFAAGMLYTGLPIAEENAKVLLNFDLKENGASITPRGGFEPYNRLAFTKQQAYMGDYTAAYTDSVVIENYKKTIVPTPMPEGGGTYDKVVHTPLPDTYQNVYLLTPQAVQNNNPKFSKNRLSVTFDHCSSQLILEDPVTGALTAGWIPERFMMGHDDPQAGQEAYSYLGEAYAKEQQVHGMTLVQESSYRPVMASLNGVIYAVSPMIKNFLSLIKLRIAIDDTGHAEYQAVGVDAYEPSLKEAVSSGYNMLKDNPYLFNNTVGAVFSIDGVLPYNEAGTEILLTANRGQAIKFNAAYHYMSNCPNIAAKWEWLDPAEGTTWYTLQDIKANSAGAPISPQIPTGQTVSITFTPPVDQFQMRVTLYKYEGATITETPLCVGVLPVYNLTSDSSKATSNMKPVKYELCTAGGMLAWKQRMFLWGVSGAENILFASAVNNPAYYPYPNNIELFDEAILHVVVFQDSLLVFTRTKLYSLTTLSGASGFTTSLLQSKLNITQADKYVIQVVKNMVFFKSDNYYYMIVPKANSFKGELVVAPISTNIKSLLDDFETGIRDILDTAYFKTMPEKYTLTLKDFYNYVDNETLRNVYTFRMTPEAGTMPWSSCTFSIMLNYDTVTRAWTMYAFDSPGKMVPCAQNLTDNTPLLYAQPIYNDSSKYEMVLAQRSNVHLADSVSGNHFKIITNVQMFDTGYRQLGSGDQLKKRFRELQFRLNNPSGKSLEFFTDFILDDMLRKAYYKYEVKHETDPTSPNYGLLYVDRVIDSNLAVPNMLTAGSTVLADQADMNCWKLDASKFPDIYAYKVRMPVNGKGYMPRIRFISFNQEPFEFLNLNYVFRTLYAR